MPWIKIPHDDSLPPLQIVQLPEDPNASTEWLSAVYDTIGCHCIEVASTLFPALVLILDESGKLRDGWERRINKIASILYGSPFDPIVGDVILCRRSGEDLTPITDQDLDRICCCLHLDPP